MPQCSNLAQQLPMACRRQVKFHYQYDLGVKDQGQFYSKSVIRLEILLSILIEGVHIRRGDCLWCLDYNIGF